MISTASEPLCAPLRAFTGRPASAAKAAVLDDVFRTACARDLRASLARMRLYVPDGCTASVLVQHARGRVEDACSAFRLAARQVGAGAGAGQGGLLLDDPSLEKMLVGEDMDASGASAMSPGSS